MAVIGFGCYVDARGVDEIHAWYLELSKEGRARFLSRLRTLRSLGFDEWRRPLFSNLEDDGAGLGEIRFKADGVEHRPLGFKLTAEQRFIIVLPATEHNGRFKPKGAVRSAQNRKAEILKDGGRARDLNWLLFE